MTWKDIVVIGVFYLLNYFLIKRYREDGAQLNKFVLGSYLLLFVPFSELARSYFGIQTLLECAFLYASFLVAYSRKQVVLYSVLTTGYLLSKYIYTDVVYDKFFVTAFVSLIIILLLFDLKKVIKKEKAKDGPLEYFQYYMFNLMFLFNSNFSDLDHLFFLPSFFGCFYLIMLANGKSY